MHFPQEKWKRRDRNDNNGNNQCIVEELKDLLAPRKTTLQLAECTKNQNKAGTNMCKNFFTNR